MKNTGKDRNKEYVTVGEIKTENCIYVIKQPKNDPTAEEVAEYHSFVADLLYAKMKRGNA